MKAEVLRALVLAQASKRAAVVFTKLGDGSGDAKVWIADSGEQLPANLDEAAERAMATDDAFTLDTADGPVFVRPYNPPLRLFIVGAVHIADPLAKMSAIAGYAVTIIDPRAAFARSERWPGMTVQNEWPDEALAAAGIDHRSAVVALTHDPKIDDPALVAALQSTAFYVGALGSGKTHAARLKRIGDKGVSPDQIDRIHGPIGLRIGSKSPAEIAISILAEMTSVLRRVAS